MPDTQPAGREDASGARRDASSPGLFITVEGADGVGKTTHADLLEAWLRERGDDVLRTREPGGTSVGREIRELVLHSRDDITARAEALLFAADRAQHIATVVRPALAAGRTVLQDRYLDSSIAYQGTGRVLEAAEVRALSLWAAEGLLPDITLLLDADPGEAVARRVDEERRFDRIEAETGDFMARVREAFLALAEAEPERFVVVSTHGGVDEVQARVREAVQSVIEARARR